MTTVIRVYDGEGERTKELSDDQDNRGTLSTSSILGPWPSFKSNKDTILGGRLYLEI